MGSVTQKVSNYILGMSEQTDEVKQPGQVNLLQNGIPDVVRGCVKRPGSHLVKDITTISNPYGDSKTYAVNTGDHTKWFSIYTDNTNQYIGQVTNAGVVTIWRCSDGAIIPVDYSSLGDNTKAPYLDNSALSDEKSSDIQPFTINQTTFFVNRRKTVEMETSAAKKSPPLINEAFIELKQITYGKQYALDIYDPTNNTTYTYHRATSLGTDEDTSTSNISNYVDNGKCEGQGREVCPPSGSGTNAFTNTGTPIHASSPPNQSASGKANLRYEMDTRCNPITVGQESTQQDDDKWNDAYTPFGKLQFGGEGWTTGNTHTFRSSKGLETTIKITNHVVITSRANVAMVRPEPTASNAEEHVSSSGILSDIKATLDGISGTGITCTIIGNGLHLYRATPFGVSTPERQLMSISTSEVNTIADLPKACRHGYTVRVANSGGDQDDYYLKFLVEGIEHDILRRGQNAVSYARSGTTVTVQAPGHGMGNDDQIIASFGGTGATDGLYTITPSGSNAFTITDSASGTIAAGTGMMYQPFRHGEGVWEEVAAPGVDVEFKDSTMPLKMTFVNAGTYAINGGSSRTYSNGVFKFDFPDWSFRDAGDDITNPKPSFVGHPIQKIMFFRNRIALLSEENIILSRTNNFYNFWAKTALTISNADPIDLQSSSTYPTKLFDGVETNAGLVLSSASQQFLLSSGAEALLTPETAKISFLSSYAFNSDTKPWSMGTTIGLLNSTAKNARFYEMANISSRGEPSVLEQSKIVSKLFPANSTVAAESNENDLVLFAVDSTLHTATNEVWGYKYFNQGDKRIQNAWFKWLMPNPIVFHVVMDDVYYVVLKSSGNKYTLESFDIKLTDDTILVGTAPDENRVHLDTKKTVATGDLTYNSGADTTTFTLGAGYYSTNTLTAYTTTAGDKAGRSYDIPANKITGTAPNQTVTLEGNWKNYTSGGSTVNTDLVVGYEYEYVVELPKIYITKPGENNKIKSETRGSLVIHRLNFLFGDVGVIDVTLKRKGRDDYTKTYESLAWDNVLSNTPAIQDGHIHTIPVYERNTNLSVHVKSNHPSPASLFSMNWEGDYSNQFYQRV